MIPWLIYILVPITILFTSSVIDFFVLTLKTLIYQGKNRYPCGGGVEYPTMTLQVIGGDEKGSLNSETVK
jgi:hypothetical protein